MPAEEIARDLTARGVARERVTVTGIPVAEEFVAALGAGAGAARPWGSRRGCPCCSSWTARAAASAGSRTPRAPSSPWRSRSRPLVVTGREEALEARLRQLAAGRESRVKVFGYVDNVRQLMAAADFLVTKAGGLTLGEALAAELPVICFGSLPGQEARNERFAAMAGVALVASSGAQLQRVIGAALRDPVLLRNIRERIRSYRRPQAAAEIVEHGPRPGGGSRRNAPRDRRRVAPRRAGAVGDVHVGLASPDARAASGAGGARQRAAALTFDDGPDAEHTPRVLDILARERVQGRLLPHRGAGGGGARRRAADRRRGA